MKLEICVGEQPNLVDLPCGTHRLGGAPADALHLKGLPPGLLSLVVDEGSVVVVAHRKLSLERVPPPLESPRLMLPGERLHLDRRISLSLPGPGSPEPAQGTAAVIKDLLSGAAPAPLAQMATLTCLTGLELGRVFPLAGEEAQLGRGALASLRLRDRTVSRVHARVLPVQGGHSLEDLGSPNGTYLNGDRLRGQTVLEHGDLLELGTTQLRFSCPIPPPLPMPAPGPAPQPRSPSQAELWLLGLGGAVTLLGACVSWGLLC